MDLVPTNGERIFKEHKAAEGWLDDKSDDSSVDNRAVLHKVTALANSNMPHFHTRLILKRVGLQRHCSCFDVVNEEKLDSRPAEECAGVVPEECAQGEFEWAHLQSLVQSNANVHVIPSKERTQTNPMEFESYVTCKDVYG
jgi:hypothetical protein